MSVEKKINCNKSQISVLTFVPVGDAVTVNDVRTWFGFANVGSQLDFGLMYTAKAIYLSKGSLRGLRKRLKWLKCKMKSIKHIVR